MVMGHGSRKMTHFHLCPQVPLCLNANIKVKHQNIATSKNKTVLTAWVVSAHAEIVSGTLQNEERTRSHRRPVYSRDAQP